MRHERILFVDGNIKSRRLQSNYFKERGYLTRSCGDVIEAIAQYIDFEPHFIVLSFSIGQIKRIQWASELRYHFQGHITVLSSNYNDPDHLAYLNAGINDYVPKPIMPEVLLARLLRQSCATKYQEAKSPEKCQNKLLFGRLSINKNVYSCTYGHTNLGLSKGEFELLWILCSLSDQVVSRDYLTRQLRGFKYEIIDRTIDNRLVSLRRKISKFTKNDAAINTVRGVGYVFCSEGWI